MICFPLDNTEYEANALGAWCGTRTRGVLASDTHYVVSANGDMTVTVSPGLAWLKADTYWGVDAFEINPQVLTVETADGSLPRIDAVCVRLDKNQNHGEIVIKKGAYSPQPPAIAPPVRNLDYDEIYVATIRVRAGTTSILTTDITDQRLNENYCGIMRDGVTGIPTQALYDMWMAWFEQTQSDASAYFSHYQQMVADLQADFEVWVETIKGILDDETAGHLQLEIEALQSRVPTDVIGTIDTHAATRQLYPICALFTTTWAFGMGGAGIGPAGGDSVVAIDSDMEFNEYAATVTAPAAYRDFTDVNQLSDTMFAFLKSDTSETASLVLKISKED